jgi:signal transduction histidine kinase
MLDIETAAAVTRGYEDVRERMIHLAHLLMGGVELSEVLQNVARAACEVARYDRCVVVTADPDGVHLQGRAGHGVSAEDVAQIRIALCDVPELADLLPGRETLVLPADDVARAVPREYVELFEVTGTLIVIPLSPVGSSELRGLVFVDRRGRRFTPTAEELQALVDFTDVAALVLQNAMLAEDSRHLAGVLERSRMATELHDGVTQMLFAVDLALQEALAVPRLPAAARAHVLRAQQDVARSSQQLRAALFELTQDNEPASSPPAGRASAVSAPARAGGEAGTAGAVDRWLDQVAVAVDEFFRRSQIGVDLQVRGEGALPTRQALDVLLRAVREGLANIHKHAGATEVMVVVRRSDHWWMVEVHDDGTGDPAALRRGLNVGQSRSRSDRGYGLHSLKRQAAHVGGRLWLSESTRLQGLQLTTSVPTGEGA